MVDLYCIAVLQVVAGLAVAVASLIVGARGLVFACPFPICIAAAVVWYVVTVGRWLWQRTQPSYRNVAALRRRYLAKWLLIDTVLLVVVTDLLVIWVALPG